MEQTVRGLMPIIEHYLDIRRYDSALSHIREGLAEQPTNARLHYLAGRAYYGLDRYPEASASLREAFQYGHPGADIHYLLGLVHTEQKNWLKAERSFLDALGEAPHSPRILAAYGALLIKMGHRGRGLVILNEARRIDPNETEVLRHELYYNIARNHDNGQMMSLEKYIQNADDACGKLLQMGMHAYYRRDYKRAKEHFREAYLMEPTNEQLLNNLRHLEYKTNPLLFPIRLADKIGGMPFFWFWAAVLLLAIAPYSKQTLLWGGISAAILCIYLYFAKIAALAHQEALNAGSPYLGALFRSPYLLKLGLLLLAVLLIPVPILAMAAFVASRWIPHQLLKKRSL